MEPLRPARPGRPLGLRERRRLRALGRRLALDDPGLADLLTSAGSGRAPRTVGLLVRCIPHAAATLGLAGLVLARVELVVTAAVIASLPGHRWLRPDPPPAGRDPCG